MKKSTLFVILVTFAVTALFYFFKTTPQKSGVTNAVNYVATTTVTNTPTPVATTNAQQVMSMVEVAKHNTRNDCYLVIRNNVYDVTSYISSHPAGPGKIISVCGQEVTGIFAQIHSNRAWDLLSNYKIGSVN